MSDSYCIVEGTETLAQAASLLRQDSHDHHALVVEVADAEIRYLRKRVAELEAVIFAALMNPIHVPQMQQSQWNQLQGEVGAQMQQSAQNSLQSEITKCSK